MKLTKYFMPLAAIALLASCSNDNVVDPGNNPEASTDMDAAYFTVSITPGLATRAGEEGSIGEEEGQDYENKIHTAILVFTDDNNIIKSTATMVGQADVNATVPYVQTFKVSLTDNATVENLAASKQVYVICNYSEGQEKTTSGSSVLAFESGQNIDKVLALTTQNSDMYWSKSTGFLMSNAEIHTVSGMPQTKEAWKPYNKEENAYPLGKVIVQRAMARFDISKSFPEQDEQKTVGNVKVEFDGVAFANVDRYFNLFKKTGNGTNWTIGGIGANAENTTGTYANDPFATEKKALLSLDFSSKVDNSDFTPYFYYPAYKGAPGSLNFKNYSDLKTPDNVVKPDALDPDRGYFIFDYCTPNTFHDAESQKNAISTAVVFRGRLLQSELETVPGMKDGNPVYAYKNNIFGDLAAIKTLIGQTNHTDANTIVFVTAVKRAMADASNATELTTEILESVKGVSKYSNSGLDEDSDYKTTNPYKYYAYYYYWNKHITGSTDGTLEPNEFGVVRNNVYKLYVTKVTGLGVPGDDPDPIIPTDPDDPEPKVEAYFDVAVEVLPWVVRENGIEF